jgi:hypothetical protein
MPAAPAPARPYHPAGRGSGDLRPFARRTRVQRRLGYRLATGMTPAQAATAEGSSEAEVGELLADPAFAMLVEEFRALEAQPEAETCRRLASLARFLLAEAVAEGDVRAAVSSSTRIAAAATRPARWPTARSPPAGGRPHHHLRPRWRPAPKRRPRHPRPLPHVPRRTPPTGSRGARRPTCATRSSASTPPGMSPRGPTRQFRRRPLPSLGRPRPSPQRRPPSSRTAANAAASPRWVAGRRGRHRRRPAPPRVTGGRPRAREAPEAASGRPPLRRPPRARAFPKSARLDAPPGRRSLASRSPVG